MPVSFLSPITVLLLNALADSREHFTYCFRDADHVPSAEPIWQSLTLDVGRYRKVRGVYTLLERR